MCRVALSTPGEHLHTLLLGNSESHSSEDECQCLSYRFLHNTLLDLCVFNAKECLICDCHLDSRVVTETSAGPSSIITPSKKYMTPGFSSY